MSSKLVSIVIPCYNAEKFIKNTLKTVLKQTYSHFEIFVIDDGSKDTSADIVTDLAKTDARIRYVYQPNGGVSSARNHGIKLATGSYIAFLDSDDFWHENNLEKKIEVLENDLSIDWIYSDVDIVDIDKNILSTLKGNDKEILKNLLIMEQPVVPAISSNVICKKKCFQNGDLCFDTNLSTSADLDFGIQLSINYKGKRIPEVLIQYLRYGGNMSDNVSLYEKDMTYLLDKNKKQNLYFIQDLYKICYSNFYQTMFLSFRKINKKKSLNYLYRMVKARPLSLFKLGVRVLQR